MYFNSFYNLHLHTNTIQIYIFKKFLNSRGGVRPPPPYCSDAPENRYKQLWVFWHIFFIHWKKYFHFFLELLRIKDIFLKKVHTIAVIFESFLELNNSPSQIIWCTTKAIACICLSAILRSSSNSFLSKTMKKISCS